MKEIKTYVDEKFIIETEGIGNYYLIKNEDKVEKYIFYIFMSVATIHYSSLEYIEEIVEHHHQHHFDITKYQTIDQNFFKSYDAVPIFKLPISILQPSQMFLNSTLLKQLQPYFLEQRIIFPVEIINDEYVILDEHHFLFLAQAEGIRMVEVYVAKDIYNKNINLYQSLLYIAKEQNIKHIKDLQIVSKEEYTTIKKELEKMIICS